MIKATSLFSGSGGNCTLIDTGDKKLLIDAGGTSKAICNALAELGYDIQQIKDVFITHEHSDHTHALEVLLKRYPMRVHMTKGTAAAMKIDGDSPLSYCSVIYNGEFTVELGGVTVEAFSVPHDSADCVGYKITCDGESVGIVTDVGYITQRVYDCLCGCRSVMLEANHDREMVKCGCYPQSLKNRILSGGGHLSNEDCAEIAGALARQGTKHVLLVHLSRDNNTPELALSTVKRAVEPYGVTVNAAQSDAPTVLA